MKKIGRYDIIAELGQGAMGVVYRASDPTAGREVALKVLSLSPSPEGGTDSPRQMFMREVQAAAQLSHPSIVAIYEAFEDAETQSSCVAMEMVPGVSLEKILESSPLSATEEALKVMRQVAEGLDYAHQNQVIHRDLKPANILVTMDGRAKITDFGIAKVLARQSAARTLAVTGTPSFMSPEQVKGGEVDTRTDIFSLGVILFTMLVGKKPFSGNTAAVMFKIVFEEPPAPSSLNPQLTPAHDYVVKRCLAKEVSRRYSSAREVINDLDDLEHGRQPRSQAGAPPIPAAAPRMERSAAIPPPGLVKPAAPPPSRATPPPPPAAHQQVAPPPKQVPPPPMAPAKPVVPIPPPKGPPTLAIPAQSRMKDTSLPAPMPQRPAAAPAAMPPPMGPPPIATAPRVDSTPLTGQTLHMRAPDFSVAPPQAPPSPPAPPSPTPLGGATMIGRALPTQDSASPSPPLPPPLPREAPGPPAPPGPPAIARPVEVKGPVIFPTPPAAGPTPHSSAPTLPPDVGLVAGPAETPGAASTAPKSKLLPIALGGVTVILLAGAFLGYWGLRRARNSAPAPVQVAVQTTSTPAPAPETTAAPPATNPAESPAPPPTEATEPTPATVTPAPAVVKKTAPRRLKQAATQQPAAPEPAPPPTQPEPAVATPPPQPAAPSPSPEDVAKAEAARLASIPRIIQVSCNFGMKEATMVFSGGGKPLFEDTLKGNKMKSGFLGIKGSYQGTLTHTITIPAGVSEVSVRVYAKDGAIDLTKPIKMPPPGGFIPTLNVQVDNEHLSLDWKGSSAAK
jgi:serine/threonine protein kinase